MIVRVEVHHHIEPVGYWQLKRCQVQLAGMMQDVGGPALFQAVRFDSLEDSIRHAKKATFTFLEKRRHTEMPDQIDWRVYEDDRLFPCPICQQPLYRKAKLGRFGNTLDLHDWGCSRCKKTVTLNTDGLICGIPEPAQRANTPALSPSPERIIKIPIIG